jgi:hypothetical protein
MLKKYSFFPVFAVLLGGLAWWSMQVESAVLRESRSGNISSRLGDDPNRRELIESLDRIVSYEHYYHSVYGHFTKLLNRIGLVIPRTVSDLYDIRVTEASNDRLLITAYSELNGKMLDLVSIDQDFQLHANFSIPQPRSEYLRTFALKQLRLMKELPAGQIVAEQGVFKGYFEYIMEKDSDGQMMPVAMGIRPPVAGMKLEPNDFLGESNVDQEVIISDLADDGSEDSASSQLGQHPTQPGGLEEETYLAQQIFYGEVGRYARSWSELARIANFKFEGRDQFGGDNTVLFGDTSSASDLEASTQGEAAKISREGRKISSVTPNKGLEIEPISSDDSR